MCFRQWFHPHHGVVGTDQDVPIVEQKEVGDVPQAGQCLAVAERDGLATRVAGGHDEGRERRKRGECFEEQVVQRGVGQHDADAAHVRRNGGRQGAARCEHHDGPFGGGQDGGFRIGNTGDAPGRFRDPAP